MFLLCYVSGAIKVLTSFRRSTMSSSHFLQGLRSEDIVIRCTSTTYTVAVGTDAPQVGCRTFEEALDRAGTFAAARSVDVWWSPNDEELVRLTNYRLLRRIWAEFMEMPGLRLTFLQAQRLWGVDARTCKDLLENLVGLGFLTRGSDGRYRRLTEGRDPTTWARMAKAEHTLTPPPRKSTLHKKPA
jgi:hypothetical protein